jgi:outer membrane protein insertion porin family
MRTLPVVMGLAFLLGLVTLTTAQERFPPTSPGLGPRLDRVVITGNQRVEEEAIRVQLRSQPGTRFNEETVDKDVRALYRMGFFDNVEANLNEENGLWVLTFHVTERPLIKEVKIEGNKKINREDLEGAFKIRPNTIFDPEKVRSGIEEAKKLYEKKGYLDAKIDYETTPAGENQVNLVYKIDEGKPVRISKIILEGTRAFTPRQLKKVMQTQESWFLSFLTGAGNLDNEALKTDIDRLTAFYYDHGYIDVKIDEPVVKRVGKNLQVTIKIDEGDQYKVGTVDIAGELLPDMTKARDKLSLKPGEIFRTSKLRDDITALTEAYGDQGYAFVNVTPDTLVNPAQKIVDVTYKVNKGPEVYIDKIDISGNTKTRDKVIRRELELGEQQRFSGSKLRRSQERLRRLGFFEDVNITTRKAESEDKLDLLVDVKEASTGAFSAGAGVSSGESFLFNLRLSEINLFGRGQRLILNADFGQIQRNFSVDFTEPYFMDTELTTGVSLFNWELIFDEFTRGGTGGSIRTLYPFSALGWDRLGPFSLVDTRFGLEYRLEEAEISDVSQNAATVIQTEQGSSLTSAIIPRLFRDTRNHPFDPTTGSLQDLSFELAGLGGQSKFIKAEARTRWYYPFYQSPTFGTFVFSTGTTLGYGLGYGDQRELPLFERYFPGGINSVRGFRILSLGPRNTVSNSYGQEVNNDPVGGSQQLIFNEEIIFPIVESLGLKGVAFFDAGNAFSAAHGIDFGEMRMAVGPGLRWLSPIGPLRIELGFPLNPRVGDDEQTVMFSFGGPP